MRTPKSVATLRTTLAEQGEHAHRFVVAVLVAERREAGEVDERKPTLDSHRNIVPEVGSRSYWREPGGHGRQAHASRLRAVTKSTTASAAPPRASATVMPLDFSGLNP